MFIALAGICFLLMIRSIYTELRYYQAIREFEPSIWQTVGAPSMFKAPWILLLTKNNKCLQGISNALVQRYQKAYRMAGIQFISSLILLLLISIVYFNIA